MVRAGIESGFLGGDDRFAALGSVFSTNAWVIFEVFTAAVGNEMESQEQSVFGSFSILLTVFRPQFSPVARLWPSHFRPAMQDDRSAHCMTQSASKEIVTYSDCGRFG